MKLKKIFFINLKHRVDRLFFCEKQLQTVNYPVERIDAVEDSEGFMGCTKSHLKTMYYIHNLRDTGYYLILEDDFFFTKPIDFEHEINMMEKYKSKFYCLSYTHHKKKSISEEYQQLLKSFSTCAYLFHSSLVPSFIFNFEGALQKKIPVDVQWNELQKEVLCIGYKTPQILQMVSFSNITKNTTLHQFHDYILVEPNKTSFPHFLVQFVNVLYLSMKYQKFIFFKDWDHFKEQITMTFYEHKRLSTQRQTLSTVTSSTKLLTRRNYFIPKNSGLDTFLFDESYIPAVLSFLRTCPSESSSISIGVLVMFDTESFFPLHQSNFYEDSIKEVQSTFPKHEITVFTNKKSKLLPLFEKFSVSSVHDSFLILQQLLTYDVIIVGNDLLSWWCANLHSNTNRKIFVPSIYHRSRDKTSFPCPTQHHVVQCCPFTIVLFHFTTDVIDNHLLLQTNIPVVLYTSSEHYSSFHENFKLKQNIIVRQLHKNECRLYPHFPESSEELLLDSNKIQSWCNVAIENPFGTQTFFSGTLSETQRLSFEKLVRTHSHLSDSSVNRITSIADIQNLDLLFGKPKKILKYTKKHYLKLIQSKCLDSPFSHEMFSYPTTDLLPVSKSNFIYRISFLLLCVCLLFLLYASFSYYSNSNLDM